MKHVVNLIVGSALSFLVGLILGAGMAVWSTEVWSTEQKNRE